MRSSLPSTTSKKPLAVCVLPSHSLFAARRSLFVSNFTEGFKNEQQLKDRMDMHKKNIHEEAVRLTQEEYPGFKYADIENLEDYPTKEKAAAYEKLPGFVKKKYEMSEVYRRYYQFQYKVFAGFFKAHLRHFGYEENLAALARQKNTTVEAWKEQAAAEKKKKQEAAEKEREAKKQKLEKEKVKAAQKLLGAPKASDMVKKLQRDLADHKRKLSEALFGKESWEDEKETMDVKVSRRSRRSPT